MDRQARSKMNIQIYEEACTWFVECRAGDLDDAGRREFDRWLRKSPEHLSSYLEIAAIWNEGPSLDPGGLFFLSPQHSVLVPSKARPIRVNFMRNRCNQRCSQGLHFLSGSDNRPSTFARTWKSRTPTWCSRR